MKKDLSKFEQKNKLYFKNKDILKSIFIHRSYLNEHTDIKIDHNERLEFLGDAVLELIVTDYLYRNFNNPEGELTNWRSALVKGQMLSNLASEIEIDDYLYLSHGEQKSTGKARQIILANAFEALIGGIYLDRGYDEAKKFVFKHLIIKLPDIIKNKTYLDAKSNLQELSQEKFSITPSYILIEESGPDHNKVFEIGVLIGEKQLGVGRGSSKQEAEQAAAKSAIEKIDQL